MLVRFAVGRKNMNCKHVSKDTNDAKNLLLSTKYWSLAKGGLLEHRAHVHTCAGCENIPFMITPFA